MEQLKNYLVVCDMDNTLLTAKEGIPACNLAAIRLFMAMGGRFTVATGRPPESIRAALQGLELSCPAIACGGSVLYDLHANEAVDQHFLNQESAVQAIEEAMAAFPDLGVEIMVEEGRPYVVRANQYTTAHMKDEKMGCVLCPLEQVPANWAKVVFAAHPAALFKVQQYFADKSYPGLQFVSTNFIYFEIMPEQVSKASALKELCRRELIPMEHTIVIGDYFNDLKLMAAAGYSVAVGNAPPEVQNAADEVVARCTDGGVGEYLYALVKKQEGK